MTDETIKQLAEKAADEIATTATRGRGHRAECIISVFTPAIREEILKEREACAKIAEQHNQQGPYIATHIRARGDKK